LLPMQWRMRSLPAPKAVTLSVLLMCTLRRPAESIDNACIPCVGPHPKNVILLCCDASGVLPPVSKLTKEQAMYHFISGYTSKMPGTEMGVTEPSPSFSACYGAAFLMWHPYKYASMLAEKMQQHGTTAWLINTGWAGGRYGVGKRMSISNTRAIIDAIHSGELEKAPCVSSKFFGFNVPTKCTNVPSEVLIPETTWADKADFDARLKALAVSFVDNFKKYADGAKYVGEEMAARIVTGGPKV
jgi:phosphoenolpyruvate carboxykinase (ATP)